MKQNRKIWQNYKKIIFLALIIFLFPCMLIAKDNYIFNQTNLNNKNYEWKVLRTVHFNIYYPYGFDKLAYKVLKYAKSTNYYIGNYLRHNLNKVATIVIYPSQIEKDNSNMKFSIYTEVNNLKFKENKKIILFHNGHFNYLRKNITRKLVKFHLHNIFFNDHNASNLLYLTNKEFSVNHVEALADYIALGFDSSADNMLRSLVNKNKSIIFNLENFHAYNTNSKYILRAIFFFIESNFGKQIFAEILKDTRDLENFKNAIVLNTGLEEKIFIKKCYEFYKKRYTKLKNKNKIKSIFKSKKNIKIIKCSPDYKKIAYLQTRSSKLILVIRKINKNKFGDIIYKKTISCNFSNSQKETFYKNISWSSDSQKIVYTKKNTDRDEIIIINTITGDCIENIKLPFYSILDVSFTHNSQELIFVAQTQVNNNIYLYNIKKRRMKQLTKDKFSKRFVQISKNKKFIIYSINRDNKNLSSNKYKIEKYNLISKKREIISSEGNNFQPELLSDNKNIIYISDRTGINNVYRYNLKTNKTNRITDLFIGAKSVTLNNKNIIVLQNNYKTSTFRLTSINNSSKVKQNNFKDLQHKVVKYPQVKVFYNDIIIEDSTIETNSQFHYDFSTVYDNYSLVGVEYNISDNFGNSRLMNRVEAMYYDKENYEADIDIKFLYLKYYIDLGLGLYKKSYPFSNDTYYFKNEYKYNYYNETGNFTNYGSYIYLLIPFSKHIYSQIQSTVFKYERDFKDTEHLKTNIYNPSISLVYNTLNYDSLNYSGSKVLIEANYYNEINNNNYKSYSIDFYLTQNFKLFNYSGLHYKFIAGQIFNENNRMFNYYLGGYSTLPAYTYGEFSGTKMFLFSTNLKLSVFHGINLGIVGEGSIALDFFANFGSAWSGKYEYKNEQTDEFEDLKSDMGAGVILGIDNHAYFKLDYAWPYYYKSFGDKKIIFSFNINY